MGGWWYMEVFKMAMYVAFPVGLFHYFNSPGNIDDHLLQIRESLLKDPKCEEREKSLRELIEQVQLEAHSK